METTPADICAAFVPDEDLLATMRDGGTIRLWNWRQQRLVRSFPVGAYCTFVAVSPDGALLATCGLEGPAARDAHKNSSTPLQVWETATGKLLRNFGDSREGARYVAFAADDRRLVAATENSVDIWDVLTGEELSAPDGKPLLSGGHKGEILCAAISPDGKTIASGSADTTILLWDAHDLLPKTPATHPTAKDLDRLWDHLRSDDAPAAYKTVLTLLGTPDQATAFLKDRMPPDPRPDAQRVKTLLAHLDADDFETRESAGRELGALGEAVEPALRDVLAGKPSAKPRDAASGCWMRSKKGRSTPTVCAVCGPSACWNASARRSPAPC